MLFCVPVYFREEKNQDLCSRDLAVVISLIHDPESRYPIVLTKVNLRSCDFDLRKTMILNTKIIISHDSNPVITIIMD